MAELNKRSKYNKTDPAIEAKINPQNLDYWKAFERSMSFENKSAKTIYQYKRDIMQFLSYLVENEGNNTLDKLDTDDIEEFVFWCKENGNNVDRIKRRMSAISSFYTFLKRKYRDTFKENPCEIIKRPEKTEGDAVVKQTFLTHTQYYNMRQVLRENNELQLLTYAVFSVDTMARVNAVSSVKWEQIDFDENTVDDVLEKEGKIVTLYFNDDTKLLLQELLTDRKEKGIESPYVFLTSIGTQATPQILNDWCKKIGKLIGIESLHPHDFRHSGSQLLNVMGAPIEFISELLNHKSLDVTKQFYLRQDKKRTREQKNKYTF